MAVEAVARVKVPGRFDPLSVRLHLVLLRWLLVRLDPAVLLAVVAETLHVVVVLLAVRLDRLLIVQSRFPRLGAPSLLLEQLLATLLVQLRGLAAVHLEPPVANQLRLLEDGAVRAEERDLSSVVADVEYLDREILIC